MTRRIATYDYYKSLDPKKVLIVEEPIIHWHLIMQKLLLNNKLKLLEDATEDKGLFPKAVIYCYADRETLFKRTKLRKKSNALNQPNTEKILEIFWTG